MERRGASTVMVIVGEGVSDRITMGVFVFPVTGISAGAVAVATAGVELLTPITTGVGETMDGVCVGGRKGVGGV
jgi:hypothetical protein